MTESCALTVFSRSPKLERRAGPYRVSDGSNARQQDGTRAKRLNATLQLGASLVRCILHAVRKTRTERKKIERVAPLFQSADIARSILRLLLLLLCRQPILRLLVLGSQCLVLRHQHAERTSQRLHLLRHLLELQRLVLNHVVLRLHRASCQADVSAGLLVLVLCQVSTWNELFASDGAPAAPTRTDPVRSRTASVAYAIRRLRTRPKRRPICGSVRGSQCGVRGDRVRWQRDAYMGHATSWRSQNVFRCSCTSMRRTWPPFQLQFLGHGTSLYAHEASWKPIQRAEVSWPQPSFGHVMARNSQLSPCALASSPPAWVQHTPAQVGHCRKHHLPLSSSTCHRCCWILFVWGGASPLTVQMWGCERQTCDCPTHARQNIDGLGLARFPRPLLFVFRGIFRDRSTPTLHGKKSSAVRCAQKLRRVRTLRPR